ncbi:MAG: inverse autotransporter beta domain-containing protein [Verrucomicrobiota bacterium]|nr:inverse autotransporter beta domain-containing protein [Verrucomicrobiota bacterium]
MRWRPYTIAGICLSMLSFFFLFSQKHRSSLTHLFTSRSQVIIEDTSQPIAEAPKPVVSSPPLPARPPTAASLQDLNLFHSPEKEPKQKILYPIPKRIVINHNSGYGDQAGIGYGTNYTSLEVFLASDYSLGSLYPLIDLRAHRFDNDSYAANLGVGGRYIPSPNAFCEILGFNVFYDWRQGFLNEYNQIGVGIEILGKRWDFRANGYFPVGAKSFQYTCVYDNYEGNYVITNTRQEITTYGFNAEVGWLAVNSKNFLLYTAAGPYYLTTKCNGCFNFDTIFGGRVRIRPQYKDYIALDLSFSHDPTFNTIWEATFIISLPLYQIANQNERPCGLTDRQIYQPIERFETMPLGTQSCWTQNY